MEIKDILNEAEIKRLQKFLEDDLMKQAVKKILLRSIYQGTLEPGQGPDSMRNFFLHLLITPQGQEYALSNEELGAKFRARVEGIALLEDGFTQLEKLKETVKIEFDDKNQAR